jgi:hypothetical protein
MALDGVEGMWQSMQFCCKVAVAKVFSVQKWSPPAPWQFMQR